MTTFARAASAALLATALWYSSPEPARAATAEYSCGRPSAPHSWCDPADSPAQRAAILLAAMSQSEKIDLLTSKGSTALGIPSLAFQDGPHGAGGALGPPPATALPSGTALAASFDRVLAYQYGSVVGTELRHRGKDGVYGPNINLVRVPMGGRNFETYGEDPYLASQMVIPWIRAVQAQGVMTQPKHFVGNDQEGTIGPVGVIGSRYIVDAKIDERTLHEVYLLPFEKAVREAQPVSVMCAFNRVNGVFACAHRQLLTATLRERWGFSGFVGSDAGAAHETADDLNAGLNVDLLGTAYTAPQVTLALATGQVSEETLDARVLEILRSMFAFGVFDRTAYPNDATLDDHEAHDAINLRVAEHGITLLKNDGRLPIDPSRVRSIAVIGMPANIYLAGGGSAGVVPYRGAVTAFAGIRARAAQAGIAVSYDDGSDPAAAAATAAAADLAIVVAADVETEGKDRLCLDLQPQCAPDTAMLDWGDQDALIQQVATANPATVVVLQTGAPVLTPWRSRVAGLLEAWFPGQDGGTAIARVLFGDVDPGGRLPVTFPASAADLSTAGDPTAYPGIDGSVDYKEGVMIGHRSYDLRNITPAFPFGHGLSYTRFSYGQPSVQRVDATGPQRYTVAVTVTNTGTRAGWAVPQVYVSMPATGSVPQPPLQLKGFRKVYLKPGKTTRVSIVLDNQAFRYWDVVRHDWQLVKGVHRIMVGSSSRELALAGSVAR